MFEKKYQKIQQDQLRILGQRLMQILRLKAKIMLNHEMMTKIYFYCQNKHGGEHNCINKDGVDPNLLGMVELR
tara:strand:- start:25 stop:243 length:219 start_codon:yes stop_codon:yes gene_type:complete